MRDPEPILSPRARAVGVAKGMVAGSVELFEGLRELVSLREMLIEPELAEELGFLAEIEGEVADLPVGAERSAWSRKALVEADRELDEARRLYREPVLAACRYVVQVLSTAGD